MQRRALEDGKQETGIERGAQEVGWVDEKQQLRMESLGAGVERVGLKRNSFDLPSYGEALKD